MVDSTPNRPPGNTWEARTAAYAERRAREDAEREARLQLPHYGVCSLGKGRWYWAVWRSFSSWADHQLHNEPGNDPLGTGYAADKATAERGARAVAGGAAQQLAAQYVASYHRKLVSERRAAAATSAPAPAPDATEPEFAYAWWFPWDDSPGHWIRHRIVKRTATRIYLERKQEGRGSSRWNPFDLETVVIDREAFERDGFAEPTHSVFAGGAHGFYAAPYDREPSARNLRAALLTAHCFAVLGIDGPCTRADVERAYLRRARETHPDAGGDPEAFMALRDAFDQALQTLDRQGVAA